MEFLLSLPKLRVAIVRHLDTPGRALEAGAIAKPGPSAAYPAGFPLPRKIPWNPIRTLLPSKLFLR